MNTIDDYYGTLELLNKWDKKNNTSISVASVNEYKNKRTYTLTDGYGNTQDVSATNIRKMYKNGYKINGITAIRSDGTIHISRSIPRIKKYR